jgi:glycosyltransferase involved in cell wall biosynthesis
MPDKTGQPGSCAVQDPGVEPVSSVPIRILELRSVWGTGGGPDKTILYGAAQTDSSRFEVIVCYVRDLRDQVYGIDQRAKALGLDYVEAQERHSFDRDVLPQLRRIIRDRRVDIVHAHDFKTNALVWWLARDGTFIPLTTAHGWADHSAKARHVYNPADRWLMGRFPRVIAVSSVIRDDLARAGVSPDRIEVVLNAIDPGVAVRRRERDGAARGALGLPATATVVGAVGRLDPLKNFSMLIDVFARIAPDVPEAMLVIAGDGDYRETLQREVEATGLASRIRLLGHQGDVAQVHHALDVFVQSSDTEGTPNAVLEAMAFENPVVATAAGGTAEIARPGREALIVPCRTPAALEAALRDTLVDPVAARQRAQAARRRVEGELSFQSRMRRVEAIYEQLVERHPAVASGPRIGAGGWTR